VIRLWRELNSTVIFVTHNIEEAVYLAERILVLSAKPTTIKTEVIVNLNYPRDITAEKFVDIRNKVTNLIKWW